MAQITSWPKCLCCKATFGYYEGRDHAFCGECLRHKTYRPESRSWRCSLHQRTIGYDGQVVH